MRTLIWLGCAVGVVLGIQQYPKKGGQMVVRDKEGAVRMTIGEIQPGVYGVIIGKLDRGPQLRVFVDGKRVAGIEVMTGKGKKGFVAYAGTDGRVDAAFTNADGEQRIALTLDEKDVPLISLLNNRETAGIELSGEGGGAYVRIAGLKDEAPVGTMTLGAWPDQRLLMRIQDREEKRGLLLGQMRTGVVGLQVQEPGVGPVTLGVDASLATATLDLGQMGKGSGSWVRITKGKQRGAGVAVGTGMKVLGKFGVSAEDNANVMVKNGKGVVLLDTAKGVVPGGGK